MKDKITVLLFIAFIIVLNVLGLWFLMGGNLSDLLNNCFNSEGCK